MILLENHTQVAIASTVGIGRSSAISTTGREDGMRRSLEVLEMPDWTRIPAPIEAEQDLRTICGLLAAAGLTVRIVKARSGTAKSAPFKKYIEYREE